MIQLFKKSIVNKPLVALLLFCLSTFSFKANANGVVGEVNLPAGTKFELETAHVITSRVQVGESVDFSVRADVIVDGNVVIRAGSIAKGVVISSSIPKGLGKEGRVEVQLKSVQAVDGKTVPLSATSIMREGEDKSTLSILLGVLVCILFLTMKGKDAFIPAGVVVEGIVSSNMKISV